LNIKEFCKITDEVSYSAIGVIMQIYEELLKRGKAALPKTDIKERFEMPKPIISYQGRQTIIRNIQDIAKAIRREPKHIAKYLFKELAVPGNLGNEIILTGKISADLISKRLDDYFKEFVLCEECKKPDTHLDKSDRFTFLKCEACGAKRSVRTI